MRIGALTVGIAGLLTALAGAEIRMDYLPAGPEQPQVEELQAFWSAAQQAHADLGEDYEVRWFGIDAKTTRGIFDFIRAGEKTGTYTLPWLLEKTGQRRARVGDHVVLIDYDGTPTLLLRIIANEQVPFGAIDARITSLDGPSVREVDVWKPLHQKFWDSELAQFGLAVTGDMPVLVEHFALIFDRDSGVGGPL